MIFSMKKKFDEKGYYWNRAEKGWMKTIVGLDKTKKNGYSLLGDFVSAGVKKNDYDAGLYLNCNKGGGEVVYQLLKVTEDEEVILLQEMINPGRGWAVEFWENIDANLDETAITPSYPDRFLNRHHLYAYLEHIHIHTSNFMLTDEGKKMIDEADVSDFPLCKELGKYAKEIRVMYDLFFREYSMLDVDCDQIKEFNNLLNLNYLEQFRPDADAGGFAINVRTNQTYYHRQKMILMFVRDGKLFIRWFNHTLE